MIKSLIEILQSCIPPKKCLYNLTLFQVRMKIKHDQIVPEERILCFHSVWITISIRYIYLLTRLSLVGKGITAPWVSMRPFQSGILPKPTNSANLLAKTSPFLISNIYRSLNLFRFDKIITFLNYLSKIFL